MATLRLNHQQLLWLSYYTVIIGQGIFKPYLTEEKLLAHLHVGITSFPYYRFGRFSLEPYPHISLNHANISGVKDIADVIRTFDCTGCKINANLQGENLQGVQLTSADLSGSSLRGANLQGARLSNANLSNADLSFANLHEVNAPGARFDRANLFEAVSQGGNFERATFRGAHLARFCMESCKMSNHHGFFKGKIVRESHSESLFGWLHLIYEYTNRRKSLLRNKSSIQKLSIGILLGMLVIGTLVAHGQEKPFVFYNPFAIKEGSDPDK